MYTRILVPLDGSDVSAQSLPYASLLARATGARMDLLQVIPPLESLMRAATGTEDAFTLSHDEWREHQDRLRRVAEQQLADSRAALPSGIRVGALVRDGKTATTIVEEAEQQPGTLIVMSTHGRSGLGRLLLGSVTDKVVRRASGPVLVIRARKAPAADPVGFQRIILPLDGSPLAEQAVPTAVGLAKAFQVPVTIIRSISLSTYGYGFDDFSLQSYAAGDFATGVRDEVKEYLDRMEVRLLQQGVPDVAVSAPDGNPADMVLTEAGSVPDSLIVMTTHGRSGVGRLVLGSVTDIVVRRAPGPVLVIRSATPAAAAADSEATASAV